MHRTLGGEGSQKAFQVSFASECLGDFRKGANSTRDRTATRTPAAARRALRQRRHAVTEIPEDRCRVCLGQGRWRVLGGFVLTVMSAFVLTAALRRGMLPCDGSLTNRNKCVIKNCHRFALNFDILCFLAFCTFWYQVCINSTRGPFFKIWLFPKKIFSKIAKKETGIKRRTCLHFR